MTPDEPRPARSASSRARTGSSARPVDPAGQGPVPRDGRGGATTPPPSFAPGSGAQRTPAEGTRPVVVGPSAEPTPTRVMPGATAPARPASIAPRSATSRPTVSTGRAAPTPAPDPRRPASPPPGVPGGSAPGTARGGPRRIRVRKGRIAALVVVLLLVAVLAWPVGLVLWANGKVQHTAALSGAANTPGTTYLLTGSDSRADGGVVDDGTTGARTDTILLLHVPPSGPTALISLPRDTYVDIPGHGAAKLNAAFAWGGAPLLVQTVEGLTGLTVDHYAEIGMAGVEQVVDAVGGVHLCYDHDVDDRDSKMTWTAGCHDVGGEDALAFARMRKSDPTGDVGRAQRQRQLIGAVMGKVSPSSLALHPGKQVSLIEAGTGALTVGEGDGIVDLGRLALAFRAANGPKGITGTPPIASLDYRPGGVGSTVLLDPDTTPAFFADIRDGKLPPGPVGGVPGS